MSENEGKGFSFRRLFFRDAEQSSSGTRQAEANNGNNPGNNPVAMSDFSGSTLNQDKTLIGDFVQRLHNHINANNQSGFDFIEFTETLFEESQNPDREVYKLVFRIAQKIDKALTPERLIQSAGYYKELVQQTANTELSRGENKKKELFAEKETEKNNLEKSLKETRQKIDQLSAQIAELQNQEISARNQLTAIDQKYNMQFKDIDTKIHAINAAKEQVISSIVDVEAGIKTNL